MQIFRRRLRSLTWVALFAIFGLALVPTLSHALASFGNGGGFNPWAEVCSAAGASVSAAAGTAAPDAPTQAGGLHLEHCPLCGTAGHAPALPMADAALLPAPAGADFIPALFSCAPRPLFAWAAAQPRGPPARS